MNEKNQNSNRQGTTSKDFLRVLLLRLDIFCILLSVSFCCKAALGETDSGEIDPVLLMTTDSQQEPELTDVQISSHAELLTSHPSQTASYLTAVLSQPAAGISTNFVAEVNSSMPQNSLAPAGTSPKKLERQLWDSRITSLPQEQDANKTSELKQLVEQVRSVKFEPHQQGQQQPVVVVETASATATQPAESAKSSEIINEETLQLVEQQLKDPNKINNPFELAEILFKSGRQSQAGICYKQAFKLLPADDPNTAKERAWILFQIGNCIKDDDPNAARESYAELIRTHSDSPWAELAKVRYGLIEWEQQEHPQELVRQNNKPNQ